MFRRRRRWRHVLAITAGAVALVLGTAIVAARLAADAPAGTPSAGTGAALYAAGALAAAWGGAGGFTRRLGPWLAGTLILGVLAVLAFLAAAALSGNGDGLITNGRTGTRGPAASRAGGTAASSGAGRVLAAELLDQADIDRLLGPGLADLQTPGAVIARSTSLALWRRPGGRGGAGAVSLSLTVKRSGRQAGRLRDGRRPPGAQPVGGLPGGYAQQFSGGRVTRVRAGRGDWVVALQLRGAGPDRPAPARPVPAYPVPTDPVPADSVPTDSVPADSVPADSVPTDSVPADSVPAGPVLADPVPPLAACVDYVLDLLTVASAPVTRAAA